MPIDAHISAPKKMAQRRARQTNLRRRESVVPIDAQQKMTRRRARQKTSHTWAFVIEGWR